MLSLSATASLVIVQVQARRRVGVDIPPVNEVAFDGQHLRDLREIFSRKTSTCAAGIMIRNDERTESACALLIARHDRPSRPGRVVRDHINFCLTG
ncbi:hypothetical protein [Candidatus Villigracilis saccharophilus]|uniref:hypothetical protein n=1 Tax=Candidatus Villigracilis saccharophilus TaxID=3140684 RepID=UPI0031356957|nr:hypothetical protein [Anaerolineales bacterium]